MTFKKYLLILFLCSVCSCGGSGGGDPLENPPQDNPSSDNSTPDGVISADNTGQVLLGPIVDATIFVYPVESLDVSPICTTTSTGIDDERGPGVVDLSACALDDSSLYLLVVQGGLDIDANDDGELDATPTAKDGSIRALMTGEEIAAGGWRINLTTELAVNGITDDLLRGDVSVDALLETLDQIAEQLFESDINGDGVIDRRDLTAFVPEDHVEELRGLTDIEIATLLASIHAGDRTEVTRLAREILLAQLIDLNLTALDTNFFALDYVVNQSFVYSAGKIDASTFSLRIIDLIDLDNAQLVGELDIPVNEDPQRAGISMEKSGNYLYVAAASIGLIVLDVSNPAQPASISITEFASDVSAVAISGNTAFLGSSFDAQVMAVDITDPSSPVAIGSPLTDTITFDLIVSGDFLYVYGAGLSTLDVSNPGDMLLLDNASFPSSSSHDMAYKDGYIYLPVLPVEGAQRIDVFNVADPNNIFFLDGFGGAGFITDIVIDGNYLYARTEGALTTFSVEGNGALELVDSRTTPPSLLSANVDEGRVYIGGAIRMIAYDQNALDNTPINLATYFTDGFTSAVELFGDGFFAVDGSRLVAYGISNDDAEVTELGSSQGIGPLDYFVINGSYAYLSNNTSGLRVIDISDPSAPNVLGNNDELNQNDTILSGAIAAGGGYVYMAVPNSQVIGVFDVSDPSVPSLVTTIDGLFPSSLEWRDDFLYVGTGALVVYDVSDPETPSMVTQVPGQVSGMHIEENYLYTTSPTAGLSVVDISTPASANQIGNGVGAGVGTDVFVLNDIAYVSNRFGAVDVYDIRDKTSPIFTTQIDILGSAEGVVVNENFIVTVNGFGLVVDHVIEGFEGIY